jgi:uncharacterized SAM-binding protein YcdF (DUF218 family)
MRALLRAARRAVALALVLAAAWAFGLVWFAATLPSAVDDSESVTDAIVVLTGGADRVAGGIALLDAGKGRMLFVSGAHKGVALGDLLRQAYPGGGAGRAECGRACIVIAHEADDTVGNAAETAAWMEAEGFASLRLVTAAYHMPRSLLEFRRAMPGRRIVPNPVFPDAFKREQWWRWPGTVHLLATEYTKYLGALLRPLLPVKSAERKS